MADSNHFTALRDKDKYKDRDRDRENAYKGLSIALAENHAAFSECHASYLSTDSTKPGHEYHCILGPYFFKEVPEAIQMASQLAQHGNVAPYACTREAASWQKQSRKSSGWLLSTKSEWPKWVNRLKTTTYADHWKRAGIYDAIIMSTSSIPLDRALVAADLCFWNTATNTMDLPGLGMMSPTLLDVAAITGFRPHGKEVSALTIPHPKILNWDAADRYSYSNFMEHYFKANEEEEVKMEEHIAFLLYWLCKYVFCVTSGRVIKEWAGLAEALALSDNIALGPIVLAHLYRGLQKMVQQRLNGKTTTSGPIWLFQMWLQLYFPELAPPLVSYHQAQLLGASLVAATLPDHTLEICFNTLQKCTHRTDDQWSVCLKRTYPSFLQLLWPSSSNVPLGSISRDIWASILTTRELHFGVKMGTGTSSHIYNCGAELYCPNHFSRQLGCLQYIPVPLTPSVNMYSSWRKKFEHVVEVKELSKNYESICRQFKHRQYTKSFKSTNIYNSWWENKMSIISSVESKHKFGELCLHCSFKQRILGEENKDHNTVATIPVHQTRLPARTEDPSSKASILPSKRTQSDRTHQAIDVIILEDEEDEESEDEMPVASFISKKHKSQEFQNIPNGFGQVKSESQNHPSITETRHLRNTIQEKSKAASPSESSDAASTARKTVLTFMNTSLSSLVDMESFERFKKALQVLKNSGDVSSNTLLLQSRLQELEAHLPDFRDAQREIRVVDEGLALLPNATSKMEASVKQCFKIEDRVNKLNLGLAELEAEIAIVRTERDQALGELNLELDMKAPIQRSLDRASELKERKNQLAVEIIRISKQYETSMAALMNQLGLD